MSELYIGLMSGTSMDGIDAALVSFGYRTAEILATHEHAYPDDLREALLVARNNQQLRSSDDVPDLHRRVGESFLDAAHALLEVAEVQPSQIAAIGSHGQTLRHEPAATPPYSLQIGDAGRIADETGIITVADFRRADIELGGQGAPLAPAFHDWLFRSCHRASVVLNIGGIANITVLHSDEQPPIGFDTGPGNTLLDAWMLKHNGKPFDRDGAWGARGSVDKTLLAALRDDAYFRLPAPKSTGFEYFNLDWLAGFDTATIDPVDVQATLCQLSADTIAQAIIASAADVEDVLVCGGGIHNIDLMARLGAALPAVNVASTATAGLEPDWVEAAAFAWLAMRTLQGQTGNLPSVTGASRATVLGKVHRPEMRTS